MDFDLLVIGQGDAGIAAARAGLQLGARVALAGGVSTRLDTGLRRGISRHIARGGPRLGTPPGDGALPGWTLGTGEAQLAGLFSGAHQLRRRRLAQLRASGAAVIDAPVTSLVPGGAQVGGQNVRARATVLTLPVARATSGEIPGAEHLVDAAELLASGRLPARALVVGDGVRVLEVASWLAALGSRVTALVQGSALASLDPELLQKVVSAAAPSGLALHEGTLTLVIRRHDRSRIATFKAGGQSHECEVEQVVVVDDGPGTHALQLPFTVEDTRVSPFLEAAIGGLYLTGQGRGRCFGSEQEARIAARNAVLGNREEWSPELQARVAFSVPEVAAVGELTAAPGGHARPPFVESLVELSEVDEGDGFLRLFFDHESGNLAGATACGPLAEDLVEASSMAMRSRMTFYKLAALPAGGTSLGLLAEAARRVELAWQTGGGKG